MTIPAPFSTGFPLTLTPFKSRTEQQLDIAKNYFAVAFKPGYPLQASELNEIQEIFYIQQTLNVQLLNSSNSWTAGTTPWTGVTPMSKSLISFTGVEGEPITINPGWYHIKDPQINGGIGVWVYNNTIRTVTAGNNESTTDITIGFTVKTVVVECTNNSTPSSTEDSYLQDQSNFNVIGGPCGAARIQLQIISVDSQAGADTIFVPMFVGPRIAGNTRQITFVNSDYTQVTIT